MPCEPLAAALAALPLAIAADGVMVPFRPRSQTPKGKIQWREVKVGILARLGTRLTRAQQVVPQLLRRRLVAVLGGIDQFIPQLHLEAKRQAFESTHQVIWLSAGGRGFWRVYRTCFAHCAVAVFDFFHAAAQLARLSQTLFGDSHSAQAQAWFRRWRHLLRHRHILALLRALTWLLHSGLLCPLVGFSGHSFTTLLQVQAYFQRHHRHIRYRQFEQRPKEVLKGQQIPLGSGMVESACRWLIQQRFKGVGLRWSESGFNHLLLLRLALVNQRFDSLFPNVPVPPTFSSPNR